MNPLSVVAFALAWFPVTAFPGLVLAHMSYDQIAAGSGQRGIGLVRWAIVISYLLIAGGVFYLVGR